MASNNSDGPSGDKTKLVHPLPAPSDDRTGGVDDRTRLVPPPTDLTSGRASAESVASKNPSRKRLPWPDRDRARTERQAAPEKAQRPTRRVTAPGVARLPTAIDDEKTRLLQASSSPNASPEDDTTSDAGRYDVSDPVVGWLVVVNGPGRGRSLEIGYGANAIGRDSSQKLCVDFGDRCISRDRHAVVIFDPRSRRFYLQSGDVRNLTYIGESLVLAPTELNGGETIVVGETQLRFIRFCGPEFRWD